MGNNVVRFPRPETAAPAPTDPVGVAVAFLCEAAADLPRVATEESDRDAWILFKAVVSGLRTYEER